MISYQLRPVPDGVELYIRTDISSDVRSFGVFKTDEIALAFGESFAGRNAEAVRKKEKCGRCFRTVKGVRDLARHMELHHKEVRP